MALLNRSNLPMSAIFASLLTTSSAFLGIALILPNNAYAQSTSQPEQCKPDLIAAPQSTTQTDKRQYLEADSLIQPSASEYQLLGGTLYKQPGMVILSDEIYYNREAEKAKFSGHLELHQPDVVITGDQALLDNTNKKATIENTRFQLLPSRTHGAAKQITLDENENQVKLQESMITTCKTSKDGTSDWHLSFENLKVDNNERRVIGKNTTLYIKDVPVFYTPYFDYPLDDRATGLLFPEFGSYKSITRKDTEEYVKLPYYFNIAPNMDDTLTALAMTHRGLGFENEFRYLNNHQLSPTRSVVHQAEVTLSAINDLQVAQDGLVSANEDGELLYGDKDSQRWRAKIKAKQNWGQGWTSAINWQEVSDEVFFKDIPLEKSLKNATYQQRNVRVDYQQGNLHGFAQILSYMRLQNFADNYEKRPELGLTYYTPISLANNLKPTMGALNSQLEFDLFTHYADFYVPVSQHQRPEGQRLHLQPKLTYRLGNHYSHLTTTVAGNFTEYQMVDNIFNPADNTRLSRFVPQFAMTAGLDFERRLNWQGREFTQTLEPQIQYQRTPFVDQSEFALFDTDYRSLDFSNLFALNRFTGMDRIGDSNQLSMALSSRIIDPNGKSILETAIGQISYFEDRRVGLNSNITDSDSHSDLFVKLGADFNQWYLSSTLQYNPDNGSLTNANSRIKWENPQHLILLNHSRFQNQLDEQTDALSVGAYSRLSSTWNLGLYSSYNLDSEQFYETQLGLRYESCCWAAEIVAERTQLENGLYNDGIQIQFELKGLSTSSSRFKNELTDKLDF